MNTIVYNRTMIAVNSNLIRRCYCTKHWCLNHKLLYPPITKLSPIFPAPSSTNYMLNPPSSLPASLSSLQIRDFHLLTALRAQEPSSKVEETVKRLKEEQEDKEKSAIAVETTEKAVAEKRTILQKVKAELLHYYHGFRLLGLDMKIAFKLIVRMLQGHELTRREHRLLVKTTGDMFRLIPFSVFIIVPFMEFLLPVFIKFFPGMLPSTFQTATDKENKLKQALKVKIEMAKFLQKTLDEMAVQSSDHRSVKAKEFSEFFCKLRSTGEVASTEDIMKFSKLFEDEITLDSLSRQQLVALCRVLDIQTLGTSNFLRFLLRMKLRNLAADDRVIEKEGVETLTRAELQQACRARGMRAYGMPENRLRDQLNQWLDLSIHKKVPPSLLLLSRAMMIPDTIPMSDKLKATISALPDDVLARTKGAIGDKEGKVDHRTNIEIIKLEEKRIEEERQEQKAHEVPEPVVENEKLHEITTTDVKVLEQALDSIGQEKKMAVEKEELKELKEEMAEYVEDIQELNEIKAEAKKVGGSEIEDLKVSKGASRLYKKVNKMISKMDKVLEELEVEEKQVMKKIEGLKHDEKKVEGDVVEELVRIDELIAAIKKIQSVPDDEKLNRMQEMLGEIDVDRDGAIKIEDVLKVIELIGKDDIKLNKKQMNELINLMEKEEVLEVEDQIQKALLKESKESKQSTTTSKSTVPATPATKAEKISEEDFINEIPEISVKATDVANDVQPSKSVKNSKNKVSTKEKRSDPEELKDPAPIVTDSIDKTISSTPPVTSTVPPPKTKKLKGSKQL